MSDLSDKNIHSYIFISKAPSAWMPAMDSE
jgi:hypothetical protein